MERRVVHGRGDSRPGSQRAALAADGDGDRDRGLRADQHPLSLRHPDRRTGNARRESILDVVGDRLLGARAGDIMAIVAIISLAAGINAWTFAGPRVYFAMARDNTFFKSAARIHPKYKTPASSILAQAAFSILLVLTGSLDSIANYVGFAITLFAGTAVAAVFVLRAREPNAPRPVQGLRLSVDAGDFRAREPGDCGERVLFRSAGEHHRNGDHPGGNSAVLLLQEPTLATKFTKRIEAHEEEQQFCLSSWPSISSCLRGSRLLFD